MAPDVSYNHWGGGGVTQVPLAEHEGGIEMEKMSHEPLGFVSGTFRGSQQRWVTMDKEGFAIVSTFRRLAYLLRGEVRIYTDHRNLAYIFKTRGVRFVGAKDCGAATRELEDGTRAVQLQDHAICGDRYCSGDLVSWWVNVLVVAVPAIAALVSSAPDETKPSNNTSCELQQQARTGLSAMVSGASSFITPVGHVTKDKENVFSVGLDGRYVWWIPEQVKEMQT